MPQNTSNQKSYPEYDDPQDKFNRRLEQWGAKWRQRPSNWWGPFVSFLTLAAIAGGAIVALVTLMSINQSVIETGRSADAAKTAADAAETANRITEDSLRARVTIESVSVPSPLVVDEAAVLTLKVYNDGASPARDVRLGFATHQGPDLPEGEMPALSDYPPTRIAPDAEQTWNLTGPVVTTELLDGFGRYTTRLFFYGRIDYETDRGSAIYGILLGYSRSQWRLYDLV